jgi:hypothetical protein
VTTALWLVVSVM